MRVGLARIIPDERRGPTLEIRTQSLGLTLDVECCLVAISPKALLTNTGMDPSMASLRRQNNPQFKLPNNRDWAHREVIIQPPNVWAYW